MIINKEATRVAIYSFYDAKGIVDGYVEYFLEDFSKHIDRLIIVSNGKLPRDEKRKFEKFTKEIIERANKGFDIWGYKEGMEYLGWDTLCGYDELITVNNTIMGPVYSLEEVFKKMDNEDVDFWGITRHYQFDYDFFGCNEYGYIPEHIQSYFMGFRNSIISSEQFQKYWSKLPMLDDYNQAVGMHESAFTKKFSDYGFTWNTYVDTEDLKGMTWYPLIDYPMLLIKEKKCPIFKKRAFFQDYNNMLDANVGQPMVELYEYIKEHTDYDENLIWDTVLRTCHQADFAKCMQLNYILSSEKIDNYENYKNLSKYKVAVFMHLYFDDLVDTSLRYAQSIPDFADIYITTNTEEKKTIFEEKFKIIKCNKLDVKVIPNRGRDVSSLLVSQRDVLPHYDIACFYHDKKSGQVMPGSVGESFGYKCAENVLYNKDFVYRVLKTFDENERLGLLSPPEPNHAEYFASLGHEWFNNFDNTYELAQKLNIDVPMDEHKEPIAPLGSVFWFRVKALEPLHNYPWKYEDFPEEPLPIDSTISHAIERLRPFAVQKAGFYPGFLMVDKFARIEFTNLRQYLRNYVHFLERHDFLIGKQKEIIALMDQRYSAQTQVNNNVASKTTVMKMDKLSRKVLPVGIYNRLIKVKRKIFGPHI